MPGKAVAESIRKTRNVAAFTAAIATTAAVAMTWLAHDGEASPTWHRLSLALAVLSVFVMVAAGCTLLCVNIVRECARELLARLDKLEASLAKADEAHINKAASTAVDAMHIARLNTDAQRRGGDIT